MKRFFFQQWREFAGLTQRQMARMTGMSKTSISRIETGDRDFTGDFLSDFQQAVGCHNIGDPLNGPPPTSANGGAARVSDEDIEARLFQRAKEIRKALRAQKDKPRKATKAHRKRRSR
jgi:transcriptional regulator with XRE-family HTH domain